MNSTSILGSIIIVAQRHGNAAKASQDLARPLSEKGERQRQAARSGIDQFGPFDLVLTSPAERAQTTVGREGVPMIVLPELYFPADHSADRVTADKVYDRLGNVPLEAHLASEAGLILMRWASHSAQAVVEQIVVGQPKCILIGGHGVYTQALMANLALLAGVDPSAAFKTPLAECDALVLDQSDLRYLACPSI